VIGRGRLLLIGGVTSCGREMEDVRQCDEWFVMDKLQRLMHLGLILDNRRSKIQVLTYLWSLTIF
jgi:hypothetical protein